MGNKRSKSERSRRNRRRIKVKTPVFETRRQEAISLRKAGFSYSQIAKWMDISTKAVWMHLNSYYRPKAKAKTLTPAEKRAVIKKVGNPRGR